MAKITSEGPYQGKNILVFTEDGQRITKEEHEKQQRLNKYKLDFRQESESFDDDDEYISRVKTELQKTRAQDDVLAREKLKEKRIKLKKRLRKEAGDDEEGGEAQLPSDNSDANSSASSVSESDASEQESEEYVKEPAPKRQKTEEQRALSLLSKSLF